MAFLVALTGWGQSGVDFGPLGPRVQNVENCGVDKSQLWWFRRRTSFEKVRELMVVWIGDDNVVGGMTA